MHLAERIDCLFPGCENIGEKGIKKYDNLVVHMKSKHGVSPAGGLLGECSLDRKSQGSQSVEDTGTVLW